MKRIVIDVKTGYYIDLSEYIDLRNIKIKRLWTLYDDSIIIGNLDDIILKHLDGVFLEDRDHDWSIKDGKLNYYSRVVGKDENVKILIEYEEK